MRKNCPPLETVDRLPKVEASITFTFRCEIMKARITRLHFLRALFSRFYRERRGYVFVRTSTSENSEPEQRHFLDISTLADEAYSPETDVFFGVCPRGTMRGRDEDVGHVVALWANLDVGRTGHAAKATVFSNTRDLAAEVRSFPVKPSIVVESGRGAHLYWLLNKVHGAKERGRIEAILEEIARRLRCDMDTRLNALLRLPKTVNNNAPARKTYCDVRYINFDARYPLEDFENLDRRRAAPQASTLPAQSGKAKLKGKLPTKRAYSEQESLIGFEEIDLTRDPTVHDVDFGDESYLWSKASEYVFDERYSRAEWNTGTEILFDESSANMYDDVGPVVQLDTDVHEQVLKIDHSGIDASKTIELTDAAINEVLAAVRGHAVGSEEAQENVPFELVVDPSMLEESAPAGTSTASNASPAENADFLQDELSFGTLRARSDPWRRTRVFGIADEIDLTDMELDNDLSFDGEFIQEIAVVEPAPVEIDSSSEILLSLTREEAEASTYDPSLPPDIGLHSSDFTAVLSRKEEPENVESRGEYPETWRDFQEHVQSPSQDTFIGGEEKGFVEAPSIEPIPLSWISGYDEPADEISLDTIGDHELGPYLKDEDFKASDIPGKSEVKGDEDESEIDLTTQGKEPADTGPFLRFEGLDHDVAGLVIPSLSYTDALGAERAPTPLTEPAAEKSTRSRASVWIRVGDRPRRLVPSGMHLPFHGSRVIKVDKTRPWHAIEIIAGGRICSVISSASIPADVDALHVSVGHFGSRLDIRMSGIDSPWFIEFPLQLPEWRGEGRAEPEEIDAHVPENVSDTQPVGPITQPFPPARSRPSPIVATRGRAVRNLGLKRIPRSRKAFSHRGKKPVKRPGFLQRKIGVKPRPRLHG